MARTTLEKIERNRAEQEQLKKQERELLKKHKKQERDARTKRLCTRHGMLEKHMPDLIKLTDREFETFITRAINTTYGREALAKIIKQATVSLQGKLKLPCRKNCTFPTTICLCVIMSVKISLITECVPT